MKRFFKYPWVIIVVCLAITAYLALQLRGIRIDNNIRQYVPHQHESYQGLLDAEDMFGSSVVIGVSIATEQPSIITPENLQLIDSITQKIEVLDNVESLDTLTNIDYVYGLEGGLAEGPLLDDDFSGSEEDVAKMKQRISDWEDMYSRVVLSDDGKAAQMQISIDPDSDDLQRQAALDDVRKIVLAEIEGKNLVATFYGDIVLSEQSRIFMLTDLTTLIPLVTLVVLITLFLSFKTLDGTLLPLISVLMGTIWACGIMAKLGITFTIVSSVIPVALIACGSAYGIHMLTHYYIALDDLNVDGQHNDKKPLTKESHHEAVFKGIREVFTPVLLAGLTTVAGFLSLVTSPIEPLHSFAIFTASGIGISLVLALTLIPALLMVKPLKRVGKRSRFMEKWTTRAKEKKEAENQRRANYDAELGLQATPYRIFRALCGTKARFYTFSILIVVFSFVGVRRLVIDTSLISYFPYESQFRQDVRYVDRRFAGTNSVMLVVSSEEKGGMTNPEILQAVDSLQDHLLQEYEGIGKIVSFTTFIKRMNQVMHVPDSVEAYEAQSVSTSGGGDIDSFDSFDSFDSIDSFDTVDSFDTIDSFDTVDSFADDTSGDTGDTIDSFDVPSFDDGSSNATLADDYVDPNIEYAQRLATPMTVKDGLDLLASAYANAGGANASVEDIVDVLERLLNYNGAAYYEVPYDVSKYPATERSQLSDLVSQYLLLLSGSESLGRFADNPSSPSSIKVQIQLRSHNTAETGRIIDAVNNFAAHNFPEGYSVKTVGVGELEYVMTNMIVSSQFQSLIFSIACVFVILAFSFKSAWAGLLGSIPLAFTILLNYMIMGFTGINLDLVTSIIASVAVGVGIDYTIHFLESYRAERALSDDLDLVVKRTFRKSGHAIITNALAVGLGFIVLYFSQFIVLRYIGILIATVMFTSSLLAMTVIPSVLVHYDPKFIRPKGAKKGETESI